MSFFTTLLSSLQSNIANRFVVANFFPMLAFWFGHGAMLFLLNAPFHTYVVETTANQTGLATLLITVAVVVVIFAAYVLGSLLSTIQSIMEGNWPRWIASLFVVAQMARFERLNQGIDENRKLRGMFGMRASGKTQAELWQGYLSEARQVGTQRDANNYTGREQSAEAVRRLAEKRRRALPLTQGDIQGAVSDLIRDLRANNADRMNPEVDDESSLKTSCLEQTLELLLRLIEYAYGYALSQHRLLLNRRQFDFGALPLAPTTMGNIAKSVQSYSIRRYDFNFEQFWSRLQVPAQRDKDFGPVLSEAKIRLDFLISLSVLTLLWAIPWAVWLGVSSGPRWAFLAVALAGPLFSYVLYLAAVAQYRALANLLRSSVDLFRFDLLNLLHYPQPTGVLEERELWQTIDGLHVLYEMRDLRYVPPKT